MSVRVRFSPSPTGLLHVGGARTAIFNYFFARHHGGTFILRIEDTDLERSTPENEKEIIESMAWLGLKADEGPFHQTKRFPLYQEWAHKLIDMGKAYKCYCSPDELDAMRAEATAKGEKPMYNRKCRDLKGPAPSDRPYCIRFKSPLSGDIVVEDVVKGTVKFDAKEFDDLIILRSSFDGKAAPTYNFCVVVDDVDMKITHIIRGDDHLSNTPKQMLLAQAMGAALPKYAHLPMVLGQDKTKLSKRHGAVAVSQYKWDGYLPEAMVNALVRLGWSHGDKELYTHDELVKDFDLSGCGDSASVFDKSRLDFINAHHLKLRSKSDVILMLKEVVKMDFSQIFSGEKGDKLYKAITERAVKLTDYKTQLEWYFSETPVRDALVAADVLSKVNREHLNQFVALVSAIPDAEFVAEKFAHTVKDLTKQLGIKMPELAKPLRVLLTGGLAGPDLGLIAETLGKEKTLLRLKDI